MMTGSISLKKDTLLLRRIHPNFLKGKQVKSPGFKPSEGDGASSVDNGDLINPESSYYRHVKEGKKSGGALVVTVAECESLGSPFSKTRFLETMRIR